MKIKDQMVPAHEILKIINRRLEAVTTQYHYAKGNDRKIEAEAMAETKWQIAEMKMQLVDYLTDNIEKVNIKVTNHIEVNSDDKS